MESTALCCCLAGSVEKHDPWYSSKGSSRSWVHCSKGVLLLCEHSSRRQGEEAGCSASKSLAVLLQRAQIQYVSHLQHSNTAYAAATVLFPMVYILPGASPKVLQLGFPNITSRHLLTATGDEVADNLSAYVPQVLFWDVRVDKLLKKGNKRMDETELVWRPMHTVHLLSVAGMADTVSIKWSLVT